MRQGKQMHAGGSEEASEQKEAHLGSLLVYNSL